MKMLIGLLVVLLTFLQQSGAWGLTIPSRSNYVRSNDLLNPRSLVLLRAGAMASDSKEDPNMEVSTATQAISSCAKFATIAGIVDIGLQGKDGLLAMTSSPAQMLVWLGAFWKLSFGFNLWKVSDLNKKLPDTNDEGQRMEGVSALLKTMIWVWRQTAALLTLAAALRIVLVWEEKIPNIRQILGVFLVGAVGATVYFSAKETADLKVPSSKSTDNAKLRHQTFVTGRAMSLAFVALLLRAASFPFISIATGPLLKSLLGSLPDLPTPLGIAGSLFNLRKAVLKALTEIMATDNIQLEKETQLELANAQNKFYKGVRQALIIETVLKIVAKVAALIKGAS